MVGGAAGTAFATPIQNLGNHLYFGDPLMTPKQYITGIAVGAVTGGLVNGTIAAFNDRSFLTGSLNIKPAKGGTAPKGWITQASKKGGGTVFKDPNNPHNIIRQMPGNPNSPNVLQQNPYIKFMKNGTFYDMWGNPLPNGNVPRAHIPLNQFNINNMPKF